MYCSVDDEDLITEAEEEEEEEEACDTAGRRHARRAWRGVTRVLWRDSVCRTTQH